MAEKRKDAKGRNLNKGEGQRKDGRYYYQYKDTLGKKKVTYAWDLAELRRKEKIIRKDLEDRIDETSSKMSLNQLFDLYLSSKNPDKFRNTTRDNYIAMWNIHLRNSTLGNTEIRNIKKIHIQGFYTTLKEQGLSNSTIKLFHAMLSPAFELALDSDMIRKNPTKGCLDEYKGNSKVKEALTQEQQDILLNFVNGSIYNSYEPMLRYMLGTACRIGEVIGITWDDVDMRKQEIHITHQLTYKRNSNGKTVFSISDTKTESGKRTIPMTLDVYNALLKQKKYKQLLGTPTDYSIDGYSNFIFTTKSGKPIAPNGFNNVLKNIVNAYNKKAISNAEQKHQKPVLLPHISAHTFRHTACTRMAESGMDIKVLQYIMGHSDITITMDVYNHVDQNRIKIKREIEKMDCIEVQQLSKRKLEIV